MRKHSPLLISQYEWSWPGVHSLAEFHSNDISRTVSTRLICVLLRYTTTSGATLQDSISMIAVLNRGNSQFAILSSMVYTPSCQVTISLSDYWSSHRTANVVDRLKGSMNSRGAALAALTAASALLAYVVFRKREVNSAMWSGWVVS